jgi:hypothetical protein
MLRGPACFSSGSCSLFVHLCLPGGPHCPDSFRSTSERKPMSDVWKFLPRRRPGVLDPDYIHRESAPPVDDPDLVPVPAKDIPPSEMSPLPLPLPWENHGPTYELLGSDGAPATAEPLLGNHPPSVPSPTVPMEEITVTGQRLPSQIPTGAYRLGRDVIYTYPDGTTETWQGGTLPWRANNPGHLEDGGSPSVMGQSA